MMKVLKESFLPYYNQHSPREHVAATRRGGRTPLYRCKSCTNRRMFGGRGGVRNNERHDTPSYQVREPDTLNTHYTLLSSCGGGVLVHKARD